MTGTFARLIGRISGAAAAAGILAVATVSPSAAGPQDLKSKNLDNPTAYIPPQCYTQTTDDRGKVHNPCFTCHVRARAPNYVSDQDLQLEYAFPEPATVNHWTNLFMDRREAIAAVPDDDILGYVRASNYFDADGEPTLAARLATVPAAWDYDGDGAWSGFTPDCFFNFDEEGFDRTPAGDMTGWRAFAYVPLPGTFWPTNGSTDDVMIRLAAPFREDENGAASPLVYKVNLAIVEALIKRADVAIDSVDESVLQVDLDRNGVFNTASEVVYDWAPLEGRTMSYAGRARLLQRDGRVHLAAGLYPEGTEFLHTVRYIDVDDDTGEIRLAPRMKEVRYSVKTRWQTYADLEDGALGEIKEAHDFPDRLVQFFGDTEHGISNGVGWRFQAFVEDADGKLRPQTFEETVFCMGCHGGIGVTDDSAFVFGRKLDAADAHARGWYHWSQKSIQGTPDPIRADGRPELLTYLQENGAGDEFRGNMEVRNRFFDSDGAVNAEEAARLEDDISVLLFPSRQRAMKLNKAYREIVKEQSYVRGRDAVITPSLHVHKEVKQDRETGVTEPERAARW